MRLLIGMPDPATRSGPIACEPPFVVALRALGVEVVEATFVYGDNLDPISLATRVRRVVTTARRLRRIVRREPFDLVHLNTSFDTRTVLRDTVTLTLLGRAVAPVFLKLHGSDPTLLKGGTPLIRTLARYVVARAAAIGVLSSAERDGFIAAGVRPEKLRVVRNALPSHQPTSSREAFLESHRLPAETPLLLFISRLLPTKGLLDAVRACSLLRDRGLRLALCCVGDGPARAEAEAETARLGLGAIVRFFGFVPESEAAGFYRHCDVLVFPTHDNEGMPVVLLNALSAGLPIVTTRTRGASDCLVEPDTCLWVEPHDPEQLADRIEKLLGDGALRAEMSEHARQQARTFEPTIVARQYLEIYEGLIAADRPESVPTPVPVSTADSDTQPFP